MKQTFEDLSFFLKRDFRRFRALFTQLRVRKILSNDGLDLFDVGRFSIYKKAWVSRPSTSARERGKYI